jgi:transcription elongation factor Elf1
MVRRIDESDDTQPIVPFVPFRCPVCGRHKPITHGVRGRIRYHRCAACGCKYRSYEMEIAKAYDQLGYPRVTSSPPDGLGDAAE